MKPHLALMQLFAFASSIALAQAPVYDMKERSVSNWREQASLHFDLPKEHIARHKGLRCIQLNNYWCLKDVGWMGRIGKDADGHTAFSEGIFSARAAVRNFRTAYFKHRRKSALQIMSEFSPPDDCVGSRAGTRPDGTCIFGKNPTEQYARAVAKGITTDIRADLHLFDENSHATANLRLFLKNMSAFETGGLVVQDATIIKGICMEADQC